MNNVDQSYELPEPEEPTRVMTAKELQELLERMRGLDD